MEQNKMKNSETEKRTREYKQQDLCSKKMRLDSDLSEHEKRSKRFEKQQERYIKEGLTQQAQLFLRRITSAKKVPIEFKHLPLLRMLVETCKELILKEFEIAVWSLYLEKVVWSDRTISLPLSLIISAYAVKKNLNKDVSDLKSYLVKKMPNFGIYSDNWINDHREQLDIKPYELNQKYKELSLPPAHDLIDYNFYVDDILQIAPPSSNTDKSVTQNSKPDSEAEVDLEEDLPPPPLMNLNSVFGENKPGVEFETPTTLTRGISTTQVSDDLTYADDSAIIVNDSMAESNSSMRSDRPAESPILRRYIRSEDFSTESLG